MDLATQFLARAVAPFFYPVLPSQRVFALYLATALAVAAAIYLAAVRKSGSGSWRGLLRFCFPKAVFAHRSAVLDYKYFFVHKITFGLFLAPLLLGAPAVAKAVAGVLAGLLGPGPALSAGPLDAVLVTAGVILAFDFGIFIAHYWQHKVPLLWEFHKVHHSAEVLTPITVYRMHPVDDVLIGTVVAVLTGAVHGVFAFLYGEAAPGPFTVLGLNVALFAFYLAAYNLRHSHVWLHYPGWLAALFVSPAQHQIHHSSAQRHFDKNMGFIFSFWDRAFGTLYLPKGKEAFALGLDHGEHRAFDTVWHLYARPFRMAARHLPDGGPAIRRLAITAVAVLAAAALSIVVSAARPLTAPPAAAVHLEDLTWVEVRDLLAAGKTTAIVPTGGTEQNGPHMVLGKHNYVIRHAAGRIAEALGNALVAPVIAYVPEGEADPRDGHMRFAGTLSTPEPVFAAVLEHAARSLRAHGFTTIVFIGEHGGNQAAQAAVAARLDAEWRATGVRVLQVGDYYGANGQLEWLQAQGESRAAIGSHAGIRDTSELMAVRPEGIRPGMMERNGGLRLEATGVRGDPTRASPERGEALLRLKIDAAVRQITRALAPPPQF